jgi:hypothetical protein
VPTSINSIPFAWLRSRVADAEPGRFVRSHSRDDVPLALGWYSQTVMGDR